MSSDRIVDAARRIVETSGVDALSMRKLAAELGVAPTAIYWHVGGREELLHAVLDQLLRDAPRIVVRGATAHARLTSVANSIRRHVRTAPVLHQLAVHLDRTVDASFPGQLALAREVSAAGLDGKDAADAVRAILFLIGGFQLLEGNFRSRGPRARTSQDLWRTVDDPAIGAASRAALAEPTDTDALFAYALDRLLRSIL